MDQDVTAAQVTVIRQAAEFIEELAGVDLLPEEELNHGRALAAGLHEVAERLEPRTSGSGA